MEYFGLFFALIFVLRLRRIGGVALTFMFVLLQILDRVLVVLLRIAVSILILFSIYVSDSFYHPSQWPNANARDLFLAHILITTNSFLKQGIIATSPSWIKVFSRRPLSSTQEGKRKSPSEQNLHPSQWQVLRRKFPFLVFSQFFVIRIID